MSGLPNRRDPASGGDLQSARMRWARVRGTQVRMWVGANGYGLLIASVCGGVWGWVLARVLAEIWPLGPVGLYWVPGWLWSPLPKVSLGLLGALGLLLACLRKMYKGFRQRHPRPIVYRAWGRRWPGWAMAISSWPLALGIFYLIQPSVVPLWGIGALIAGLGGALWLQRQFTQPPSTYASVTSPMTVSGSPLRGLARWAAEKVWVVEWVWDLLAFGLPLALYVGTLAPSVLPGDSGEFQFVAPMLGIPHPTGYPLYLLLGKLFSLLPVRSVAYRLNLLSAVAAAGTVWAVYRSGRALGMRRSASLLGGAMLAVSETFWSQATIAEKYTLNTFFVALTLWLGLLWRRKCLEGRARLEKPSDNASHPLRTPPGPNRGAAEPDDTLGGRLGTVGTAWAFCYGLGLTHHRTMILLAPAYLGLVWFTDKRVFSRSALRLAFWSLAPLSLYLLLPLFSAREPPYAYVRLDSVGAFLDLVFARAYQGILFRGGWASLPGRLAEFFRLSVRQFGTVGLVSAVIGWAALCRQSVKVAVVLAAGILLQIAFALNYYVPNTYVYYLPAYVWLAVCVAPAVDAVLTALARLGSRKVGAYSRTPLSLGASLRPHLALAFVLLACAWPIALLSARWRGMDRRQAYRRLDFDYDYGQMAARFTEPHALLVSDWLPATVLWYTQWIAGQMPTAQVMVVDPLEGQWTGPVESALTSGRPTYLARPLVAAGDSHSLTSAGPLVRVLDEPMAARPAMSHPRVERGPESGVLFKDEIRLLGSDLVVTAPGAEGAVYVPSDAGAQSTLVQGGSTLHITVYWQAVRPPGGDYRVGVRLVDSAGHVWLERQNRHPVGGTYPTSRWQMGEIVGDYYRLALPSYLPSGQYQLQASVDASHEVLVDRLFVRKPLRWQNPILGTSVRKLFGRGARTGRRLLLVSYDAPGTLVPGETASIALQWLVCGSGFSQDSGRSVRQAEAAALDLGPRLVLVSRNGQERSLKAYAYSSSGPNQFEDWQPGALVVVPYTFSVPDDLTYIKVQGVDERGELASDNRAYRLPLRVAARSPGSTNFGDVIRLRNYTYVGKGAQRPLYSPGATVRLTLEWEAVRPIGDAYKVFVHVLGPHGLPVAQQDNEPVNGTYPTTRWQRGERILDSYAIRLPDDLPPGEYPVEVGLYRISDLSRLPVLDREQSVVDDKVFLRPLTVK